MTPHTMCNLHSRSCSKTVHGVVNAWKTEQPEKKSGLKVNAQQQEARDEALDQLVVGVRGLERWRR